VKTQHAFIVMIAILISGCAATPAINFPTTTLERRGPRYVTRQTPVTENIRSVRLDLTSGDAALVSIDGEPVLCMDMNVEVITALPLNRLKCVDLNQTWRDVWRSGSNFTAEQKLAWQQTKDNLHQYRMDYQLGQPWSFGKTQSLIREINQHLPTREFNCDLEPGEVYKISESEIAIKVHDAHQNYGPAGYKYVSSISVIKSDTGESACTGSTF